MIELRKMVKKCCYCGAKTPELAVDIITRDGVSKMSVIMFCNSCKSSCLPTFVDVSTGGDGLLGAVGHALNAWNKDMIATEEPIEYLATEVE